MRTQEPTRQTDEELMRLVGHGDHAAYTRLVQRHWTSVLGVAQRVLHDRGLAEEVRQDAFLAAWLARERFDPALGNVRGWLLTIVRRRALDVGAGRRFAPSFDELAGENEWDGGGGDDETASAVLRGDSTDRIRRLVDELPLAQAEAIGLVYLEDLSRSEAAARLGVSPVAVKGRVQVGLQQLRRRVDAPAFG